MAIYKSPLKMAKEIDRPSLNAPSHSIWVKNLKDEWKPWGGHDSGDISTVDVEGIKAKGYNDLRLVPNGENWDYETPKGYIDPSGYEWFDEDARTQALEDFNGYSNDLQKYYDAGSDLNAQFMRDYLKYRNRAYDYLSRNKLI